MLDGTPGKRRSKKASATSSSHQQDDLPSGSSSAQHMNLNDNGGISGGGGSAIDSLLQRLDNIDLGHRKKNKKRPSSPFASNRDVKSSTGGSAQILIDDDDKKSTVTSSASSSSTASTTSPLTKRIIVIFTAISILIVLNDNKNSSPDKRLFGVEHRIEKFLLWVKEHPSSGAAAFVVVYATCVVLLLPGTPLTLGGGYVYKITYGLGGGVAISTVLSLMGSLIGSCTCFVVGRYIMRDRVRKWGRKYPLFDSIDNAVSDNGFKIMCLLYLTPILPLGPIAYTCGTTSMSLFSFAAAKIGAAPLTLLYAFVGASTDTFFGSSAQGGDDGVGVVNDGGGDITATATANKKMGVDEETHKKMVLFGLAVSILSMSLVSHVVKKELYKIFDKQKKDKREDDDVPSDSLNQQVQLEMTSRNETLQRRQRGHDEEKV